MFPYLAGRHQRAIVAADAIHQQAFSSWDISFFDRHSFGGVDLFGPSVGVGSDASDPGGDSSFADGDNGDE